MSSPRKEYFLGEHGARLGVPFVMGVGGAIDVVAGTTRRAPRILQRLGLEWLFRLLRGPRRLGPAMSLQRTLRAPCYSASFGRASGDASALRARPDSRSGVTRARS